MEGKTEGESSGMKTTHELARELLELPDVPVKVEYWTADADSEPVALMTEYDPEGTAMICQREKK